MNNKFQDNVSQSGINVNHAKQPCVLVMDRSRSMAEQLRAVYQAFVDCTDVVRSNSIAAQCCEFAAIIFNESPYLIQDWCGVEDLKDLDITADGYTNIGDALNMALDMIQERRRFYSDIGVGCKIPYCILVTDAKNNRGNLTEVSQRIRTMTDNKKLKLWTLCVDDYNKEIVDQITGGERVFELSSGDEEEKKGGYTEFFHFCSEMLVQSSTNKPRNTPGKEPDESNQTIGGENSIVKQANMQACG